ncbi:hypothetical protein HDU96_011063, partial [Phlyctochytrium bullatum]
AIGIVATCQPWIFFYDVGVLGRAILLFRSAGLHHVGNAVHDPGGGDDSPAAPTLPMFKPILIVAQAPPPNFSPTKPICQDWTRQPLGDQLEIAMMRYHFGYFDVDDLPIWLNHLFVNFELSAADDVPLFSLLPVEIMEKVSNASPNFLELLLLVMAAIGESTPRKRPDVSPNENDWEEEEINGLSHWQVDLEANARLGRVMASYLPRAYWDSFWAHIKTKIEPLDGLLPSLSKGTCIGLLLCLIAFTYGLIDEKAKKLLVKVQLSDQFKSRLLKLANYEFEREPPKGTSFTHPLNLALGVADIVAMAKASNGAFTKKPDSKGRVGVKKMRPLPKEPETGGRAFGKDITNVTVAPEPPATGKGRKSISSKQAKTKALKKAKVKE